MSRPLPLGIVPALLLAAASVGQAGTCGDCLPLDYRLSYDTASNPLPNIQGDLLLPGLGLCTHVGSDIDAFSFTENACCFALAETTLVLYSVDRNTKGLPGLPIRTQDDCNGAAGDIFGVVVSSGRSRRP